MSDAVNLSMLGSSRSLGSTGISPEQKIKDAAQGFEAVLVRQMLRELRQSSFSNTKSDVNAGYLQIGDEQLANHIVQGGGLGFAKAMASQMLQQIETARLIEVSKTAVNVK